MNIRKGLHRLAIFVIGILFLFLLFEGACLAWSKYQHALKEINSTSELTRYRRDLNQTNTTDELIPSLGWSFARFQYQQAIDAGYSDAEIVAHLQKRFSDFDLKTYKEGASTERKKKLCYDFLSGLSHSIFIATVIYLSVFILFLCSCWIYKGFK